jgi:hypothetical protein
MPSEETGPRKNPEPPTDSQGSTAEPGETGKNAVPPQTTSPEGRNNLRQKGGPPSSGWVAAIGALAIFSSVALVALVAYIYFGGTTAAPTAKTVPTLATESRFQDSVPEATGTGDLANEWRAARSDHKIIAYVIARCLNADISTMAPDTFSMLMLDLRPNGDHFWRAGADTSGLTSRAQPQEKEPQITRLGTYEGAILALSDAVSRARVAAAAGAGGFYPQMWWFGWTSVLVSALATMVVTLRASMGATQGWVPRVAGIFAILLSTAATVLTGAKQFWDPTNAYMRNETALLALKQLHQEIVLTFVVSWDASKCQLGDGNDSEQSTKFVRWRNTLVSLQIGTMPAPVIVPNQTVNGEQVGNNNAEPNRSGGARPATAFGSGTPVGQQSVQPSPPAAGQK